jgi:hypothetical protein
MRRVQNHFINLHFTHAYLPLLDDIWQWNRWHIPFTVLTAGSPGNDTDTG